MAKSYMDYAGSRQKVESFVWFHCVCIGKYHEYMVGNREILTAEEELAKAYRENPSESEEVENCENNLKDCINAWFENYEKSNKL